jgi:hypothetical protein
MIGCARHAWLITAALLATSTRPHAESPYPVAVPDIVGVCYASMPEDCPVPPGEKWQAIYRERCAEAPAQCTFRPDGTISRWVGKLKPNPQLEAALADVREAHRLRGHPMGPR